MKSILKNNPQWESLQHLNAISPPRAPKKYELPKSRPQGDPVVQPQLALWASWLGKDGVGAFPEPLLYLERSSQRAPF